MASFDDMLRVSSIYLPHSESKDVIKLAKDIAIYFCRRCVMNFSHAEQSTKPELWTEGNNYMASTLPGWLDAMMSNIDLEAYA